MLCRAVWMSPCGCMFSAVGHLYGKLGCQSTCWARCTGLNVAVSGCFEWDKGVVSLPDTHVTIGNCLSGTYAHVAVRMRISCCLALPSGVSHVMPVILSAGVSNTSSDPQLCVTVFVGRGTVLMSQCFGHCTRLCAPLYVQRLGDIVVSGVFVVCDTAIHGIR